jgi:hypothetical protein
MFISKFISTFISDNSSESYTVLNEANTDSLIDKIQPYVSSDDYPSDNLYPVNEYMDINDPSNMNYMINIAKAHDLFGRK